MPDGIDVPEGTDIMQFCRDLAESGADFAEQFDRDSATFHKGNTTECPIGGARVPVSMKGGYGAEDWEKLPDAPLAIEEDFGPDFHAAMDAHKTLGDCKKAISVLNKPVEQAMRLRHQYKDAPTEEDRTALESRWKGAEVIRDGCLSAATETIRHMKDDVISQRTRDCVDDVVQRGKFNFEDKETFGEYMQVLQRANQAIFADQTKMLAKIKEIKKAAKTTQISSAPKESVEKAKEEGMETAVPTSTTVAAGA